MPSDDRDSTRRNYLRLAGVVGAGALGGCSALGRDSSDAARRPIPKRTATNGTTDAMDAETVAGVSEDRFETVVNVADAGADATGGAPVNSVLDEHVGDDTLLFFPPGRYRLADWKALDYRNLGVVGRDATLVPPAGENDYWLMWADLRDFLFAGFTVDCSADGVAPITSLTVTGGTNVVRDVAIRGHRRGEPAAFELAAADPDAALRFENVRLPDGSTKGTAVYVFPKSVGELEFRNCRIEHWAEGLYASYHSGPLRVVGGYYANNGIKQVRVGGGEAGALVRDVTVRVDDPQEPKHKPNMRGIWAEEGGHARIENCDIAITDLTGTYSSGAVVVGRQFGEVVVENTAIRTDAAAESPAIRIRNPIDSAEGEWMPSMDGLPERTNFLARNVEIDGGAGSGTAVAADGRDDCTFENVCISHDTGSRDGITVSDAESCAVRDSTVNVSGDALVTDDATVETENLRTDGSC